MRVEYSIDDIREGLNAWTELVTPDIIDGVRQVNEDLIIKYLNQGFCIQITQADYRRWCAIKPKPDHIHAYAALFDEELKFVLIDSTSDLENQENMDNIVVKDFQYGESDHFNLSSDILPHMDMKSALVRNFRWNMHCRHWLNAIITNENPDMNNIFKAITIPFEDCTGVFSPSHSRHFPSRDIEKNAVAFFGLTKPSGDGFFHIEFILTNQTMDYVSPGDFFDISRPVPPFGGVKGLKLEEFQLMPVLTRHEL